MSPETTGPERLLAEAVTALRRQGRAPHRALDAFPAPIYATDAQGRVTHFNEACIAFAGREPVPGADRWCVTWRLYTTDGEPLAHEDCPMAVAVRERRSVRGVEAIAERPDGSRRHFQPFPTPLFDETGAFAGAVNLLLDISDRKRAQHLADQAKRCRRLARTVGDQATVATLARMADEYDAEAGALERPN